MRFMGLDVGDKRIGIAVSDELGWTAQAVDVLVRKGKKHDLNEIKLLAEKYEISKIIVGLPKNMDGTIGFQAQKTIDFIEDLKKIVPGEIVTWDERLSSMAAEKVLVEADLKRGKRKKVVDKVAAAIILQGYLDSKK